MNINPNAKRILCYGDSNTWGWVPGEMGKKRFAINERWTGLVQKRLGNGFEIIEEGLGARTTIFDDPRPEFPNRNGLESLGNILETYLPLDLVIVMLGTTDTKEMINKSAEEIGNGMREIVNFIKKFKCLEGTTPPKILILVPPIVNDQTEFAAKLFKGATEKTTYLVAEYKNIAQNERCLFLDPTHKINVDQNEGVHLTLESHKKLAELVTGKIKEI